MMSKVRPTEQGDRALHQLGGGRLIARLMRDHAEQMQGERVLRLLLQNLAQQSLGLLQATLPLQLRGEGHRLRKGECLRCGLRIHLSGPVQGSAASCHGCGFSATRL